MPRVILTEQPDYQFEFNIKIQKKDLNYAGHLGNDALVKKIHEARIDLFKKLGYKELDLGDGKTGIIIGDLIVNYKSEGFKDEDLKIESHIGEITEKSMRIFHRIIKLKDNKILALAETGLITFDYQSREITEIPATFKEILNKQIND
jgi:4-hydroxybenzoyl-CoA thioesterase